MDAVLPTPTPGRPRWPVRIALLALAYFITGWLGLRIPYAGSQITLLWLPTGIAVAALMRWGRRCWPGISLGAFVVNLVTGASVPLALMITVGNTLGPLLSAQLLRRLGFHRHFERQRDVSLFLAAAGLGMLVPCSVGVLSLHLTGILPGATMASAWLAWWMGDSLGVLLATPLLLSMTRRSWAPVWRNRSEALLWLTCAGAVSWFAFFHSVDEQGHIVHRLYLTLPLLAWAPLRFGNPGGALGVLFFAFVAATSTALGYGFVSPGASLHSGLFQLWMFISTTAATEMMIASIQARRLQAEATLRASEEKLRGLFEPSPLGIVLTDLRGHYIDCNEAFLTLTGYSAEELRHLDYWKLTPKGYNEQERERLVGLRRNRKYGAFEKEYVRKDGSHVHVRANSTLVRLADGRDYIWSILEDISERHQLESSLRIAAAAFEAEVGIMITDTDSRILRVNPAFCRISGYSAEEVIGQTPKMFRSGRHDTAFYQAVWQSVDQGGSWQGEVWERRKNGEIYPKWITITAIRDTKGRVSHYVSTGIDTTESKAAEDEIRTLAFYDPLTSLPNRRLLLDRLNQAMDNSARRQKYGALLFMDLDHFKALNDSFGHDTGDLLLQQVARRIHSQLRQNDTVARLGGDEFVILLEDLSADATDAAEQARRIGEKILASFGQPFLLGGHEHYSSPSLGITLFHGRQDHVSDLLKHADLALYQAKAAGRNTARFFDPAMQAAANARVALEADLRRALQQQEFRLHYQPQVDPHGRIIGAEALVRWQHPERGLVGPVAFISLAEDTGQIIAIGQWVLRSACLQLTAWAQRPATAALQIAVNISARQFHHPDFVAQVLAEIEACGTNPRRLKLELTESLLLSNIDDTVLKIGQLKKRGISFALDDFGTGYSSLAYLKRLPLDQLKIDQSFVRDILTDHNDATLVRTIITLGHNLGLHVIAEGVETEAQRQFLADHGCHAYQGYLFGKPVPAEGLERLVEAREKVMAALRE